MSCSFLFRVNEHRYTALAAFTVSTDPPNNRMKVTTRSAAWLLFQAAKQFRRIKSYREIPRLVSGLRTVEARVELA